MKKKWGDETQDKKVGGRDARWTKMGRQDARQKEWGEEVQDEKNGEMRCETKKMGS